jgi:hypothetical protein
MPKSGSPTNNVAVPRIQTINPITAPKTSSGTTGVVFDSSNTGYRYNYYRNLDGLNSWIEYEIPISAGQWVIYHSYSAGSNRPIVTYTLKDPVTVTNDFSATADMYAASPNHAASAQVGTGTITVNRSGIKVLRVEVTSKNASSSAYLSFLYDVTLYKFNGEV